MCVPVEARETSKFTLRSCDAFVKTKCEDTQLQCLKAEILRAENALAWPINLERSAPALPSSPSGAPGPPWPRDGAIDGRTAGACIRLQGFAELFYAVEALLDICHARG